MITNKIIKQFLVLFLSVAIASCNKPADVTLQNEGTIYMPQATGTRSKIDLIFTSTNSKQEIVFGAAYGGIKFSFINNNVLFKVDAAKVNDYNTANKTAYTLLPDSTYEIISLNTVISPGNVSSNPLSFTVKTNKVKRGIRYMLPISLATARGTIDENLRTAYFRFDTVLRKTVDVTGQGVLTVSNENGGGAGANEGSPKLVDNNATTKYLFSGFPAATGAWFQLKYTTAVAIGAYTFTSANDASDRDPKAWKLQGSNDGNLWTDIDNRGNELFSARFETKRFEVPGTPAAFTYYRILVSALNTASPNLFQMSEWRVLKYE